MKKQSFLKAAAAFLTAVMLLSIAPLYARAGEQLIVSYDNRAAVEQAITDLIEEHKDTTPSVSILVFDDKQDICSIIYGDANASADLKADENTVYEWGSVSKLLVWTSAMQLYEQGKLDLNEDIRTYLPAGFLKNCKYDDPNTMIDLMNHSAGFQETVGKIESEDINDLLPLDKALKQTAPAQVARPGETVSYSNWSAALGGYVVQCISGMDYADYVNRNIFEKLGMQHTYMRPDASDNPEAALMRKNLHCYVRAMSETPGIIDNGECRRYINLYPAGSAGGTIADMALFAKAFLCDSKDCPLFEKDDTLDIMLSPSWSFGDGTPRICHGMFCTPTIDGLYGHGGNTEGCSSDLQLDIKNKTGYVMMTNMQSDRVYTKLLPDLLYGEAVFNPESDFEPIDIAGHYKMGRSPGGAGMLRIASPTEDYITISYKDGAYTGTRGLTKITQISDVFVEAELINGTKQYYAIKKDTNGHIIALESYQAIDFVKVNNFEYYSNIAMLILFITSVLIMSIFAVIHLIRIRKFKNEPTAKFKRTELFAALCALAIMIEFALILIFSYNFMNGGRFLFAITSILLCALTAAEAVMIVKCYLYEYKPNNRIMLTSETVCSVLTIAGIVYWRLFQWWGF